MIFHPSEFYLLDLMGIFWVLGNWREIWQFLFYMLEFRIEEKPPSIPGKKSTDLWKFNIQFQMITELFSPGDL
jgi:hypothetical protein